MTIGNIVIVGAGQAGAWVARSLRDGGHTGPVILIGDELHAPYERPPLSKEILLGSGTAEELTLLDHDECASLDIETRLGTRVEGIDRPARRLRLSGGEELSYDKLVLCTGGHARRLDLPGLDDPRVHTLRTLDDALRLKAALSETPGHVVVVGGGWIGLEVAASARSLGCEVTVFESADRLCARSVTPDVSAALQKLHEAQQVNVLLSTQLSTVTPTEDGFSLTLSSGKRLDCRHIIVAAGLVANDALARDAGLTCANGIVVDTQCRTSDPDIHAAGDVAILETSLPGTRLRLESWQNAQDQGMAVAQAILGRDVSYRPVPMVWSQQYDRFIQIAGHVNAGTLVAERPAGVDGSLRFYLADDTTVLGAIGMNAGRDFRFARQLVERSCRIAPDVLTDTTRPLNKLATATVSA